MSTWADRAKAAIAQKSQNGTAETDETAVSRLLAVLSVATEAVSAKPEQLSSVLAVTSCNVLNKHESSLEVPEDPDRWCWPHSSAMNGEEIDTFGAHPWLTGTAQSAAQAYHAHHFNCYPCIAAGRGNRRSRRCAVGLALWNTYQEGLS